MKFRERLTVPDNESEAPITDWERPAMPESKREIISSHLEGPDGTHAQVSVGVAKEDGMLAWANFYDLDKTLLNAESIHAEAITHIFPEEAANETSREELLATYFAGFKLGNSFREWDRMWRIYREGKAEYRDPAEYEKFLRETTAEISSAGKTMKQIIDAAGSPEHERANEILQRYGEAGYQIMKEKYEKDPKKFKDEILKPETMDLFRKKTRLGQANVFMTANQKKFAEGLIAFSGLSEYGLALATDETMEGGGKEVAIEKLIEELGAMGLKVNKNRSTGAGDSIIGDVGSGTKTGLRSGLLVVDTAKDISSILARAEKNTPDGAELRNIIKNTDVEVIATKEVNYRKTADGGKKYYHGKKSSQKKYLEPGNKTSDSL